MPNERIVDHIELFTMILDGRKIMRCVCSFISRRSSGEHCLACGRGTHHAVSATSEEYKASRKAPITYGVMNVQEASE